MTYPAETTIITIKAIIPLPLNHPDSKCSLTLVIDAATACASFDVDVVFPFSGAEDVSFDVDEIVFPFSGAEDVLVGV